MLPLLVELLWVRQQLFTHAGVEKSIMVAGNAAAVGIGTKNVLETIEVFPWYKVPPGGGYED